MNIETILNKYKNVINFEVSRVLCENIDLWDDAIQESLIRINANLESILRKEGKSQENYIRVISRNASRTILSNMINYRAKNVPFEEWIVYNSNAEEIYEDEFDKEDFSSEMEHCLRMLEPEEKDILYLREIEELTYEEIATALGLSKDACRKRVSRVKKHFKQIVTESKEVCDSVTVLGNEGKYYNNERDDVSTLYLLTENYLLTVYTRGEDRLQGEELIKFLNSNLIFIKET